MVSSGFKKNISAHLKEICQISLTWACKTLLFAKAITVEAEFSFPALGAVQVLKRAIEEHGRPDKVRVDNGSEFLALDFTHWCEAQGIGIQYIQPGKPMQNGFIERFNRTYRQDILNAHIFEEISQVRILAKEWIKDYNWQRPHEGLGGMTPNAYE